MMVSKDIPENGKDLPTTDTLDPLCPRRPAGQSAVWCFQCGADYTAEVTHCLECGVMTLPFPPTPVTKVGEADEEQLVYDLHEWSWEARSLMASFMFAEELIHGWQGASLVVREADEEKVDELVARVNEAGMPSLDPSEPQMEYEIDDLTDEQTSALTSLLTQAGIPYEFNMDGNLVFHEKDESKVEEVVDQWVETETESGGAGEFGEGLPSVHVPELLGTLYDMSGRLIQNIGDVRATDDLVMSVERLYQLELPYGFTREDWRKVREVSAELSKMLLGDDFDAGEPGEVRRGETRSVLGSDVEIEGLIGSDVEIGEFDARSIGANVAGSKAGGAGEIYQSADIYEEGEMGEEAVEEIKQLCRQLRKLLKAYV